MYKKNEEGLALVYVMVCLIIIGLTTSALIKMSHKSAIVQVQYSQSESARLAVHAGFEKALAFLESDSEEEILSLLQEWVDKQSPDSVSALHKWIIGKQKSYDSLYSDCKFKVQILGFDTSTFALCLHSEGESGNGNKASAVGTYILNGLGFEKSDYKGNIPTNAIQMDNGGFEINVNFEVFGNTSIKDTLGINANSLDFHGIFRYDPLPSGEVGKLVFNATTTFDSTTYFAGGCDANPHMYFKGNTGFRELYKVAPARSHFGNSTNSKDELFIFAGGNHTQYWGGTYDMHGNNLQLYNTSANYAAGYTNYIGSGTIENESIDIPKEIGLPSEADPAIYFNYTLVTEPQFTPHYTFTSPSTTLSGKDLNTLYNDNAGTLWNDFLVVHIPSTVNTNNWFYPFSHSTDEDDIFTEKVIIVSDHPKAEFRDFYESSNNSITALYVTNWSTNNPCFGELEMFRGFIYIDTVTANHFVYQPNNNTEFIGSVYGGPRAKFKFDGGTSNKTVMKFDSTVIAELADLGIFTHPDSTSSSTSSSTLILTQDEIETDLLSRSF